MREWTKEQFWSHSQWFHATTVKGAKSICENGINVFYNYGRALDFNYGFYLCPNFTWTARYLEREVLPREEHNKNQGIILEYTFSPAEFVDTRKAFFQKRNRILAEFIIMNRTKFDSRLVDMLAKRTDIIGGPMADGNLRSDFAMYKTGYISKKELIQRILKPAEDWQLVLRNPGICANIRPARMLNMEGGEIKCFKDLERGG